MLVTVMTVVSCVVVLLLVACCCLLPAAPARCHMWSARHQLISIVFGGPSVDVNVIKIVRNLSDVRPRGAVCSESNC